LDSRKENTLGNKIIISKSKRTNSKVKKIKGELRIKLNLTISNPDSREDKQPSSKIDFSIRTI